MRFLVHLTSVLTLVAGVSSAAPDSSSSDMPDSQAGTGASGVADSPDPTPEHRIVVYYFHRTLRCTSCVTLEALTVKALARFDAEQAQGTLIWRPMNLDEPDNEHFVDEFDLSFNTVVIAREERGIRVSWKSLGERVWDLLPVEDEFIAFISKEIEGYLRA